MTCVCFAPQSCFLQVDYTTPASPTARAIVGTTEIVFSPAECIKPTDEPYDEQKGVCLLPDTDIDTDL